MLNIYDEISANKRKTVIIVLLFPIFLAAMVYGTLFIAFNFFYVPEPNGLTATAQMNYYALTVIPVVTAVAFILLIISWFTGDQIVLNSADAHEIKRKDLPEIYSLVENIATTAGVPTPRVYVMADDSFNAFATGRDPEHASLALTRGIVGKLNRSELEGVIAHEMAHIANRDIRLTMLVSTGIGILTVLGQILLRSAFLSKGRKNNNGGIILVLLGFALMIYGLVIAPLIMYALSRRREYQADATAALITRNPLALASALEKISTDSRVEALDGKGLMASACIADAGDGSKLSLSGLFATHPPIKERIEILRAM